MNLFEQIVLVILAAGLAVGLARGYFGLKAVGSSWFRWLGGLVSMALAMLGAVNLVLGWSGFWGLSLAILGCALALLAVWGGDLLWQGRKSLGLAVGIGVLVGVVLQPSLCSLWLLISLCIAQSVWLLGNREARQRLRWLLGHTQLWMGLLTLAVLIRIPVPLWPEGFALIGTLQTGLISLAALLWGWGKMGSRVVWLGVLAFLAGLGVELLGSQTGFPFGLYSYSGAPGLTLLSVPILVPLGWFALTLSAHVLAGGKPWLAGLAMVAWDLGLEPLMTAKHFWHWADLHSLWYGAPLQNFLAWFVVGTAISWMYGRLAPKLHHDSAFGWAYRLEALFIPAGLALFGFWQAALVCGLAMNLLAWRELYWHRDHPRAAEAAH